MDINQDWLRFIFSPYLHIFIYQKLARVFKSFDFILKTLLGFSNFPLLYDFVSSKLGMDFKCFFSFTLLLQNLAQIFNFPHIYILVIQNLVQIFNFLTFIALHDSKLLSSLAWFSPPKIPGSPRSLSRLVDERWVLNPKWHIRKYSIIKKKPHSIRNSKFIVSGKLISNKTVKQGLPRVMGWLGSSLVSDMIVTT